MAHFRILVIYTFYYLTRYYTLAGYCEQDDKNGRPVNVPADQYCCTAHVYVDRVTFSHRDCSHRGGCCGDSDRQICCDSYVSPVTLGLGIAGGTLGLLIIIFIVLICVGKRECKRTNTECHCTGCWCEVRKKPNRYTCTTETYSNRIAGERYRQTDNLRYDENIEWRNDWNTVTHPQEGRETFPSAPPIPITTASPAAPPPSYDDAVDMPRNSLETTTENPPKYADAIQGVGIVV